MFLSEVPTPGVQKTMLYEIQHICEVVKMSISGPTSRPTLRPTNIGIPWQSCGPAQAALFVCKNMAMRNFFLLSMRPMAPMEYVAFFMPANNILAAFK